MLKPNFVHRYNSILFEFQAEIELRQSQSEFDRQYEITKLLLEGVATSQV